MHSGWMGPKTEKARRQTSQRKKEVTTRSRPTHPARCNIRHWMAKVTQVINRKLIQESSAKPTWQWSIISDGTQGATATHPATLMYAETEVNLRPDPHTKGSSRPQNPIQPPNSPRSNPKIGRSTSKKQQCTVSSTSSNYRTICVNENHNRIVGARAGDHSKLKKPEIAILRI